VTTTATAAGTRRYTGSYPAEPGQVRHARAALAGWLSGCTQADEAILIASEFDVVTAIAGPGNWGIDGDASGRIAWATLGG
jgi:hypothetical protein